MSELDKAKAEAAKVETEAQAVAGASPWWTVAAGVVVGVLCVLLLKACL